MDSFTWLQQFAASHFIVLSIDRLREAVDRFSRWSTFATIAAVSPAESSRVRQPHCGEAAMVRRRGGDPPNTDFRGLVLELRGRSGLSQQGLAGLVGVSKRAVAAWEAGASYPSAERLKAHITLYVRRGVF